MTDKSSNFFVRLWFGFWRLLRNYLVFVGIMTTVLLFTVGVALKRGSSMELDLPKVSLSKDKPSVLWLELSGRVTEVEPSFSELVMSRLLGGEDEIYLPTIRKALTKAAKDDRIKEFAINIMPVRATPAEYAALRKAIAQFRETSGKPVQVYLADVSDWTYYVASAGTKITLNPAGELSLPGPTFQLVYFGDALKKLGLSFEVVRAGKYKSAFEPFVQNTPSEPTLEEYNSMQSSLLDHIVAAVVAGRGKDESTVRGWFKKSLFTPEEARQAGIVDVLGYLPSNEQQVEDEDKLHLEDYLAATKRDPEQKEVVSDKGGIALINATGEIHMSAESSGPTGSDSGINPKDMRKELLWAQNDKDVKAIVLRISSPGGSATASDMIWNDINALAATKPVIVSMGAYAASGGYYIAAPASRIYAEPTTITGSIGVIGMLPSAEAFGDKWGVNFHMVSSSDRKQLLDLGSKASAEDKALLDRNIAYVYRTFTRKVAEGRKIPVEKVEAIAQGRVYTGLQAKEIGLVDEIGGLDVALAKAKELAGFDANKLYPVLQYEGDSFSLSQCLRGPGRMAECLRRSGSKLTAPVTRMMISESGPEAIANKVARWATEPGAGRADRALTLWTGYLSLVWQ
ncbi:MAG: signal peptide peptidase SppA [Deltaproteobacteria bacterium]|nr:signal peptide peptidase SppA [Deltaproteobacteria bacterium]